MLDFLAGLLGDFVGRSLAYILAVLLYLLMIYLVWGIIWDRILTKAGFRGKAYWRIYSLYIWPPIVLPFAFDWFGEESDIGITLSTLAVISFFTALYWTALAPWPVHQKRSVKSKKPKGQIQNPPI
jgi:hypothetical protein